MATRYIGLLASALVQSPNRANIVGAASGGTLTGSQSVQVVFDDTVFAVGNSSEGKQRLLAALEAITSDIEISRTWPIDSGT
jgi:hypothetical protein